MSDTNKSFKEQLAVSFAREVGSNPYFRDAVFQKGSQIAEWSHIYLYLKKDDFNDGLEIAEYLKETFFKQDEDFDEVVGKIKKDFEYLEENERLLGTSQSSSWLSLQDLRDAEQLTSGEAELIEKAEVLIMTTSRVMKGFLEEMREFREDFDSYLMRDKKKDVQEKPNDRIRQSAFDVYGYPLKFNKDPKSIFEDSRQKFVGDHRNYIPFDPKDFERIFNRDERHPIIKDRKLEFKAALFSPEMIAFDLLNKRRSANTLTPEAREAFKLLSLVEQDKPANLMMLLNSSDAQRGAYIKNIFAAYGLELDIHRENWHEAVSELAQTHVEVMINGLLHPFMKHAEKAIFENTSLWLDLAKEVPCGKTFLKNLRRAHLSKSPPTQMPKRPYPSLPKIDKKSHQLK